MTDLRTAAQQALEALGRTDSEPGTKAWEREGEAMEALRAALAEPRSIHECYGDCPTNPRTCLNPCNFEGRPRPVQEPVALGWLHKWANHDDGEPETQWHEGYEAARRVVQIHLTAPPQRKPLTEETLWEMWIESPSDVLRFARAIERAHGIT